MNHAWLGMMKRPHMRTARASRWHACFPNDKLFMCCLTLTVYAIIMSQYQNCSSADAWRGLPCLGSIVPLLFLFERPQLLSQQLHLQNDIGQQFGCHVGWFVARPPSTSCSRDAAASSCMCTPRMPNVTHTERNMCL